MPILIHNNPQYLKELKAKRIADKLSRTRVIYDVFPIGTSASRMHPSKQLRVPKGLVTRYNNGSNTRTY